MTDILNKTIVLVLNRNWQAINVRTPQEAICQMATNVATALEIEVEDASSLRAPRSEFRASNLRPVTWDEWLNQGEVIQAAREHCREHLRVGQGFAFNATNITRQMRQRWIELFADYGARIEIVYLEPPLTTILAQNKLRTRPVPEKVILRLVEKLEPPTVTECHSLTFA